MTLRRTLACCKLYVSANSHLHAAGLEAIREAAALHKQHAPLLHVFPDEQYSRVGYTLVSSSYWPLTNAVVGMVRAALQAIDLRQHCGSHPRLGVVDNICFHPLGLHTGLDEVGALARSVAVKIGSELQVPTFLYGAAHQTQKTLDAVRRDLGYFNSNKEGLWVGFPNICASLSPEFGPQQIPEKCGVILVGACPWISNYNIPILTDNLQIGRKISRTLSARGGGLPETQAMALLHGDGYIEIACNLLNTRITSATVVQKTVDTLAKLHGVEAKDGYFTGFKESEILALAESNLFAEEA